MHRRHCRYATPVRDDNPLSRRISHQVRHSTPDTRARIKSMLYNTTTSANETPCFHSSLLDRALLLLVGDSVFLRLVTFCGRLLRLAVTASAGTVLLLVHQLLLLGLLQLDLHIGDPPRNNAHTHSYLACVVKRNRKQESCKTEGRTIWQLHQKRHEPCC